MKLHFLLLTGFMLSNIIATAQTLTDCASCSLKVIQTTQIKGLSIDEIRFLTNDLFAREGYRFKADDINAFYSGKAWYKPKKDNKEVVFNAIEKQNIELLQQQTALLKAEREKLLTGLKSLQQTVIEDNKQELEQRFGFKPMEGDHYSSFSKLLQMLELNDLNWFKHDGFYEKTVDNGDVEISYRIRIAKNKITFTYSHEGASRITENEAIYPGHPIEFSYFWIFEFNGQLRLVNFNAAG